MVGRMEGQSVVLRAEKGKLRLMVDDEEGGGKQEMVYDVTSQAEERGERGEEDGKRREVESGEARAGGEERTEGFGAYGEGEVPGRVVGMDGEAQTGGSMPGVGGCVDGIEPVAGESNRGNACGITASGCGGQGRGVELASCGIVGAQEQGGNDEGVGAAFGPPAGDAGGQARGSEGGCRRQEGLTLFREVRDGTERKTADEGQGAGACAGAGIGDSPGAQRSHDGNAGSPGAGGVAQDLLPMGGACPQSYGLGVGESCCWEALCFYGRREEDLTPEDT